MGEVVRKEFVIYEKWDGGADNRQNLSFCGGLGLMDKRINGYWMEGRFYSSDKEDPAVICEIKAVPELVANYTDSDISSQIQQILHYGINVSGYIIPTDKFQIGELKMEDTGTRDYEYYRHGNDILHWIKSLV